MAYVMLGHPLSPRRPLKIVRLGLVVGLTAIALSGALAGCGQSDGAAHAAWSAPAVEPSEPGVSPSDTGASPSGSASAAPSVSKSGSAAPSVPASSKFKYVYPVNGKSSYAHTHHDYPASDIMAACGLPVRAVINGVILEANRVDRFVKSNPKGIDKGGIYVSLLGDDGVRYYGAHLTKIDDGIEPGVRVTAGQQLGLVGTTGNSGACHLHFGISPPCQKVSDWWIRRGVIYPWSYLDSWKAGGTKSPVTEVTAWQAKNGCPATAPAGA